MMPDELKRLYKQILGFESIELITDSTRELIEEVWQELGHKLPPKKGA